MKCFKSRLMVLLFFVVCGNALPATESSNGLQKLVVYSQVDCREACGPNMIWDDDCNCICKKGFHEKNPGSEECVENKCESTCNLYTEYCNGNECICKDGYHNDGVPGAPLCVKPTEDTTPSHTEEITHSHSTTTTLSTTTQNTTTTKLPPTHKTSVTTAKPSTTTLKPSPKPTPKPHKSGMSPWTITGIIILVASLAGLGGFIIYRQRNRGSYRTAVGR
ncbi:hypothetical protein ACLKA7_002293 [Drosophila subpalustris]